MTHLAFCSDVSKNRIISVSITLHLPNFARNKGEILLSLCYILSYSFLNAQLLLKAQFFLHTTQGSDTLRKSRVQKCNYEFSHLLLPCCNVFLLQWRTSTWSFCLKCISWLTLNSSSLSTPPALLIIIQISFVHSVSSFFLSSKQT